MKLILITPEYDMPGETALVNEMFQAGLMRLHVRKPAFDDVASRSYLHQIDSAFHHRVVIHNHFSLYTELGLGGIHLNSMIRKSADTSFNIAVEYTSTSFHSWQEIEENNTPYGYVFISPVFDSISKADYKAAIDLSGAERLKRKMALENKRCPDIIGLGGVGVERLSVLSSFGFDGAAMLGAIWQSPSPAATITAALNAIADL